MGALKLETRAEQQASGASVMGLRRAVVLLAAVTAGLTLASCDQKRSIYLDPGHEAEQPVHPAAHPAQAPPKDAPPAEGHKS
jgi:hypothetical protein